ncbi:MarR family winged helix-turn-helix transcriptional regulator [Microvirga sp. 2MCAF38]|uniref:MarR family winged helix-turn-helix transcriptional regulator n=1 Tax=Microvirga sp. 2MCAF38 TaxID=3232989 RepID=UPI003F956C95
MQMPSDATQDVWIRLNCTQRRVKALIEAALKDAGFPSLDWYGVLLHLKRAEEGCLSPREIEYSLLFEQYNLSRLLDRMEAEGLVKRIPYPGDKRRQLIAITTAGRKLQERMWVTYGGAIEQFVGTRLSKGEADQLAALLSKL